MKIIAHLSRNGASARAECYVNEEYTVAEAAGKVVTKVVEEIERKQLSSAFDEEGRLKLSVVIER